MSGAGQYEQWLASQGVPAPWEVGDESESEPPEPPEPPEPTMGESPDQGWNHREPPVRPLPTEPDSPEDATREREREAAEKREALFRELLDHERLRARVRRELEIEAHAAAWKRPPEFGTLADELAMPEEPVTYRVDRVIPAGANVVLTAQFKAGKTTMMNHLVKVLADGGDFLGKYPAEPLTGKIGIFNYEVGPAQYRRWLRDVGVNRTDHVAMLHLRGLRLPLRVRDVEDYVVDWLKRHEVQVWILDPYARALVGSGEENDNSAVGAFLDTLDVIKERAGVTELIMPAHTGRAEQTPGQERARGATRLDDWPDVRWVMVKDDEGRRYLTCSGRDVDEAEQALAYHPETRALSVAGTGRRATQRSDLRDQLLRFIEANPGMGGNELAAAFPARKADVVTILAELAKGGVVKVEPGPNRKRLYFVSRSQSTQGDAPWMKPDTQAGLF